MIETLRAWALVHAEQGRYTPVGIAFHWVMAFLVLFQLGWGFYTAMMGVGGDKLAAYQVHSAAGLPILLLAIGRAAWRALIPGPVNDADRQGVQTVVAHAIHYLFYLCFFGLPLSGWAMWSAYAEPGPLRLGGVLPWPPLPLGELPLVTRWAILDFAEDVHNLLVWLLVIIVPLHVGAALKHHFWDRHDVLRGMLPEIPDEEDPLGEHRHRPRAS
jgi:cytochrome b561